MEKKKVIMIGSIMMILGFIWGCFLFSDDFPTKGSLDFSSSFKMNLLRVSSSLAFVLLTFGGAGIISCGLAMDKPKPELSDNSRFSKDIDVKELKRRRAELIKNPKRGIKLKDL